VARRLGDLERVIGIELAYFRGDTVSRSAKVAHNAARVPTTPRASSVVGGSNGTFADFMRAQPDLWGTLP